MDNETVSVRYSNSQREARQHRNAHRAPQYPSRTSHSQRSNNSYNPQRNSHTSPRRPQQSPNPPVSPARDNNNYDEESNGNMIIDPNARPKVRDHFVAASGEFVGTFMFLFFGFAIHLMAGTRAVTASDAETGANSQTVVFISMGYGFSLLVSAWVWYRISGGLFNPAVTLGLVLSGGLPWLRGLILFPAQILGAICAAAVVDVMYPPSISMVNTVLAPGTSIAQGLFMEMFFTCLLMITVLMLAAEKSKDTFLAPIGIGLSLFVAELAGVYYTGGSLNPARSFGPAVASRTFPGYHYIYWIGPGLGALVTSGYFRFIKWLNYEQANPGQDSAGEPQQHHHRFHRHHKDKE